MNAQHKDDELEEQLRKKAARKAKQGGMPKFINLPRNWAHQALLYMDAGEMASKLVVELVQTIIVYLLLDPYLQNALTSVLISFLIVHTWNWVTNGLFWSVIIFTFPWLKNPGKEKTLQYMQDMKLRLQSDRCISGLCLYGSITRGAWHDRSDIDLRILRYPGWFNALCAIWVTMRERFIAFLYYQPMDMYLADSPKFLTKLRDDEIPLILIKDDPRLEQMYPNNPEQDIQLQHFGE